MSPIPRDKRPDSTLGLLSDGYTFISRRCRRYRSDLFQTRLMLRKVVCVSGADAARMFYHADRFTRQGAMPPTTLMLLQGRRSVQLLDGEAHRWRKQMFMSLMTPDGIRRLADTVTSLWRTRLDQWEAVDSIVLFDEVQNILCRAVCDWAGIPLSESEAWRRTREFAAMIDGAGAVGPRNWRGIRRRVRTERWIRGVVERMRAGQIEVVQGSAADVIGRHREPNGDLLPTKTVAVELINVLRPTVAVARFVTFAALALHEHPACRQALESGGEEELERFVQEVRRFYPFFPFVGGRVRNAFDWQGHRFARGDWVLLDLYGTDRDPRTWKEPEAFRPERFRDWDGSAFDFIPQGGGGHFGDHRCAGEWITIELMKRAARLLTAEMRYEVRAQDLSIDLSRIPALPRSRFVIHEVKRT